MAGDDQPSDCPARPREELPASVPIAARGSLPRAVRPGRVGSSPRIAVSASRKRSHGYSAAGGEFAEVLLEPAASMSPPGVAVMVAWNDRRLLRVLQPGPQLPLGSSELGRQRGRRQVASDQDVIGFEGEHPLDNLLDPFEPELPRPTHHERCHSQETLADKSQRIEGIPPEVDVRDVNQPERAGIERHRSHPMRFRSGAEPVRLSRWQMPNAQRQHLLARTQWLGRIRPTGPRSEVPAHPADENIVRRVGADGDAQSLG